MNTKSLHFVTFVNECSLHVPIIALYAMAAL